jgi:release factor glutamine methyltransferase
LDTFLIEKLRASWKALPDKPEESPESTLRSLYFTAAGISLSHHNALITPLPELDPEAKRRLSFLVEQRCSGIPLAYITGKQWFMGIEMLASPAASIPRVETEILGYKTLAIIQALAIERGMLTIIDLCTGSGSLVLALVTQEPRLKGFGADLSLESIEFARKNATYLGLEFRVEFKQSDLFESFNSDEFFGKVDIITCNPPYIPSSKVKRLDSEIIQHEPLMAFDGGPFGLKIITRLIHDASRFLKPDSFICFEVGLGQGPLVARMLKNSNQYSEIIPLNDNAGNIRGFIART